MKRINLSCVVEDDPAHLFLTKKYLNLYRSCGKNFSLQERQGSL